PRAEYILTDKGRDLGVVVGSLATWGSRHIYPEAALVHATCGHPVRMGYYCPHCDDRVRGASVTLQQRP
ncbi:MAG TPA: transcriptional regulator, partial [Candidatus Tectomicrobia bacterium]